RVGAGAAIAVDAAHDEIRIQLTESLLAEAHAREHARPVVLDQHVRARDEARQDGLALCGMKIERDRALVAVELREVPRQPLHDHALAADGIPLAGRLDLDHVRAHVGEQHAAERPGENPGEIDDADAGEWQGRSSFARIVSILSPEPYHGQATSRIARRRTG